MLGAIAGDTIGSVYEFHNTRDYNFPLFTQRSIFTDDSVMSFAVADWLISDPEHTSEKLEEALVTFGARVRCPMGGYGGMFHSWLFDPCSINEKCPWDGKRHPYNSWGNGSAMRASAVGWFFDTIEETERVAEISAAITHNHPEGIMGAQATAAAIFLARNGKTKDEIKAYIENRFGYDLDRSWEHLHKTYDWDSSCQGTVPEAIICFLESTDFEDSIRKSVSIGGDSDTLACINGAIAEAYYGGVPEDIRTRVEEKLLPEFRNILSEVARLTPYGKIYCK